MTPALPNLSGTISTALVGSPMFKRKSYPCESDSDLSEFVQRAGEIIFAAKKLRHSILFRECFIHLVSSLHDADVSIYGADVYSLPLPALRDDKDLWLVLHEGKSSLRKKILQAQQSVLEICLDKHLEEHLRLAMRDAYLQNPEHCSLGFRQLLAIDEIKVLGLESIEELLQNNLALDRTNFGAGEGPYFDRYLCAELADEDMPWDAAESDW
jgi:hypothetical protein